MLAQSGSRVALVDPALRDGVEAVRDRTARRAGAGTCTATTTPCSPPGRHGRRARGGSEVADTDLVQLLYTSGTTGNPKGAMMTHRALVHEYVSCVVALDLSEDDRPLHSHAALPLGADARVPAAVADGGRDQLLLTRPDVPEILRRVEADGAHARCSSPRRSGCRWPTTTTSPPATCRRCARPTTAPRSCRCPSCSGSRTRLPELGFYNCFGMSEIAPAGHRAAPRGARRAPGVLRAAGRRSSRSTSSTRPATGSRPGTPGELLYRSPQLCMGYWDDAAATEEAFRGGWFHSGDMVVRDEAGYITVVDRIKDVINTGGCWWPAARSRTRSTPTPTSPRWPSSPRPTSAGSRPSPPSSCSGRAPRPTPRRCGPTPASPGGVQGAQAGPLRRRAARATRAASCSSAVLRDVVRSRRTRPPGAVAATGPRDQTNALSPVMARPTMRVFISRVPS